MSGVLDLDQHDRVQHLQGPMGRPDETPPGQLAIKDLRQPPNVCHVSVTTIHTRH